MKTINRVLFFQQRGWGVSIGHNIAKLIHEENADIRFAAITFKKKTHEFILSQKDVEYDEVLYYDQIQNEPESYDVNSVNLDTICNVLGIDSIWPMMQSMRNYVRDYSKKYYYSYTKQVSDKYMTDVLKATFLAVNDIIERFKPDVIVLPNYVGLPHFVAYYIAKNKKITIVGATDSKVKGIYIWSRDPFDSEGRFYSTFKKSLTDANVLTAESLTLAHSYLERFRVEHIKPDYMESTWKRLPRKLSIKELKKTILANKLLSGLALAIRGGGKSDITRYVSIDNRSRRLILRDALTHYLNTRKMENYEYEVPDLNGDFVFFPLQFQPEASVDVIAPFFNNQIEAIRLTAMSLPGDMKLIVKEHPAMIGYRTISYLEKIQGIPNVVLMDHRYSTYELLKKSKLVVNINSTVSVEAAYLDKPSVQFGNLGTTLLLPHIHKHTDFTTLSAAIKEICLRRYDTEDYRRHLLHFIASAFTCGFDTNYMGMWDRGEDGNMLGVYEALKEEIDYVIE